MKRVMRWGTCMASLWARRSLYYCFCHHPHPSPWSPSPSPLESRDQYVSSFVPCASDKFASALEALLLLFSHSVLSESLWPHGLQLARLPCPPPSASFLTCMSTELVMPSNHLILCHHPSHFCFSFSQNQGLFQWVSSSHQVAKVLEFQCQTFQWIFRVDFL